MASILERIFSRPEARSSIEDPTVPVSKVGILKALGWDWNKSDAGVIVTAENAMTVPAVWDAVNFLSGTIAGLPLHVYTKSKNGAKRKTGAIADMMHDAVNEGMSSFAWRKYIFDQVFTGGRAFTYIERNAAGKPINLFPMDPTVTTARRDGGVKYYQEERGNGRKAKRYEARDIIDIPFMLQHDQLTHKGPISAGKNAIGLAIASSEYGARIFKNGGIPPLVMQGPFQTDKAMTRASDDLVRAMAEAYQQGRPAIALPIGHEAKALGLDPEKMQLVPVQRWCVEQIARIYALPPTFLQDLSNGGAKANTEQQDIHLVKHTIKRWVEQTEQEMNLKLFGRGSNTYCEFSLDGLQRGDFASRMTGSAQAISVGSLTPNEARKRENLPPVEGGDKAYIQGAMMPLDGQQDASLGDTKTGSAPALKGEE